MLFPDSCFKSLNQAIISGVLCKITNYTCKPTSEFQMTLMIITFSKGSNDTSIINILHNYFPNIDSAQEFKAGKLEGLIYQSYSCGVPVENFIGISKNKIYHYTETLCGNSLSVKQSNLKNLLIDAKSQNLRTLLINKTEKNESAINKKNPLKTNEPKEDLSLTAISSENNNSIRIDIAFKVYKINPDTVLYFVRQQYYALESTFQKSIACDFKKGISKEIISYPNICYSVKLFKKSSDINPYKSIVISYTGNNERK